MRLIRMPYMCSTEFTTVSLSSHTSTPIVREITFYQLGHRTKDLNRDISRNQALIQYKAATGFPKPQSLIRFDWTEVS